MLTYYIRKKWIGIYRNPTLRYINGINHSFKHEPTYYCDITHAPEIQVVLQLGLVRIIGKVCTTIGSKVGPRYDPYKWPCKAG